MTERPEIDVYHRKGISILTVFSETFANMSAAPWFSALVALVCTLVAASMFAFTIADVSRIVDRQDALIQKGITVLSVTAENRAYFSGTACDQLNQIPGVVAAGGLASTQHLTPSLAYEGHVTLADVTSRFPDVMWPRKLAVRDASIVAGSSIAKRAGLVRGAVFWTTDSKRGPQSIPISAIAPPSVRDVHYDDQIVQIVDPSTPIVECLVEAEPGARADVENLLLGWFEPSPHTFVSPYFVDSSVGKTPQQELDSRLSSLAPFAGSAVLVVIFFILWFGRRADFALYRLLGMPSTRLALMLCTEFLLLAWVPLSMGALSVILVMGPALDGLTLKLSLLDFARLILITGLVPLAGTALLRRLGSIESLKGR